MPEEEDLRARVADAERELLAAEKAVEAAPNDTIRCARMELLRICKQNADQLRLQLTNWMQAPD